MKKLVIVGHGMVAQRLLERLVDRGVCAHWQITVIGEEPQPAYNRIMLSPFLAGEMVADDLSLAGSDWYAAHGVRCISGNAAIVIDRGGRSVGLANGEQVPFDRLVIATGAEAMMPPLPGTELDGVQVFRDRGHCDALLLCAQTATSAVVVGGGFLGLEAAAALTKRGLKVTVLHRSGHLLNRQLDCTAGEMLQQELAQQGLDLRCNSQIQAIEGQDRVESVLLNDGSRIEAEQVVFATGIKPRIDLAASAGLACGRGIEVDPWLRTSDSNIFALGECCQRAGQTYGLVEPGYRQAEVLAALFTESNHGPAGTTGVPGYQDEALATRLKISGIELFSCGEIEPDDSTESLVYHDQELRQYRHLIIRDQRLVGAILYGDAREGPWYFDQVQKGTDIRAIRQHLAFGSAWCEAA